MATVYLDQAIRSIQTVTGTASDFEYAASSCQGWRNTMEDVHLVIPNFEADSSLFAVFDGHNGIEVASFCSKYLPDYILSNKKYQNGIDIVEGLKEAFMLLDNSILMKESMEELVEIRSKKHPELPLNSPGITSGCTAVVCLLKKGLFYCASIGDSRCVLCRSGQAFPLSVDNKPEEQGEEQRIVNAGGVVVQLSIALSHFYATFTLFFPVAVSTDKSTCLVHSVITCSRPIQACRPWSK